MINRVLIRSVFVTALLLVLALPACRPKHQSQMDEEPPRPATMLSVADPRAGAQLVSGFYALERNAWRWTASHFTVILRPPKGADQNGAVLKLKLVLPDSIIDRVKTTTLSAKVNGFDLAPETYSHSGDYTYTREVPAKALSGTTVRVDFALDKFVPSGVIEGRELGLVCSMVGFESK